MRLRQRLTSVGLAIVIAGMVACLAFTVAACGTNGGTSMEPATSQGAQSGATSQLPALDLNAPREFQTAAFAYG